MNPWLGIILVLGALVVLLAVCCRLGRRFAIPAELRRKLVHMGMGLICALFPLLFRESWPVLLLAGLAVAALFSVRSFPALRTTIGASLHAVERSSLGEIFFPIAVAAVWYFSLDRPLYYSLSVLVLTLADAFAALVGTEYGKQRYTTLEGYKTWEGSFMFFAATFLCIHVPLLLLTDTGRAESLLIALLIGILVMIVEAVAWRGLDNLFIPLSVCILLNVYDGFSMSQILFRIVFILLTIAVLFFLRSRTKLDDASLLGASLITYLAMTVGGWQWAFAPVVLFASYLLLGPKEKTAAERVHNIHALLAVTLPGFLWLLLHYRQQQQGFFFNYHLAYMAELVCIFIAQWAFEFREKSLARILLKSSVMGFGMIMVPCFILTWQETDCTRIVLALVLSLLAAQLFRFSQPQIRDCPQEGRRYLCQGCIGLAVSALPWLVAVVRVPP